MHCEKILCYARATDETMGHRLNDISSKSEGIENYSLYNNTSLITKILYYARATDETMGHRLNNLSTKSEGTENTHCTTILPQLMLLESQSRPALQSKRHDPLCQQCPYQRSQSHFSHIPTKYVSACHFEQAQLHQFKHTNSVFKQSNNTSLHSCWYYQIQQYKYKNSHLHLQVYYPNI